MLKNKSSNQRKYIYILSIIMGYMYAQQTQCNQSLYDIEKFIKTNKHLPNIPSATEVANNGIELGDMQTITIKKIEELTLYLLQLKKENDELKNRLEQLEKSQR